MKRKSILVIEDEADIRSSLEEALELESYPVLTASNGRTALDMLDQYQKKDELPGLILLDISMPEMSGLEFREKQMANPEFAKIPVVLMSAATDTQKSAEFMGLSGYLKKPMEIEELYSIVSRYT